MQLVWAERSYPITGGILASVLFHVLLALLIVLGVPSFFAPEVLEAPPTIELATLSDITAAPKVDKAGKPMDKPKPKPPAPETKKETKPEPPKPAPPTPATPPPPAPEQQAAVIPDKPLEKAPDQKKPEPKPEEKKVEEKKKAEEKPKPDKTKQDMDSLLKSLSQETPAPETEEKPKKKSAPAPAEPTTGQVTANINDVPLTMAETDGIRTAIALSFILLVSSELIVAQRGFGFLIGSLGANGSYEAMYAVVFTVAFLGFAADRLYQTLVQRVLIWRL